MYRGLQFTIRSLLHSRKYEEALHLIGSDASLKRQRGENNRQTREGGKTHVWSVNKS